MNVQDAAHLIGSEYPGGAKALAVRMDIGAAVFTGKLSPADKAHVLGLVESVRMQQLAGRFDILYAMAEELDHVCIRKPAFESADVSEATATVCVEFGQFLNEVTETMKDKTVTKNELKRMQKELTELIASDTTLNAIVAGKAR